MLSRVAESIYWMCRYIERAENIARVVNVNWHLTLDASSEPQWMPLISITADDEPFFKRYDVATQENVMRFLAFESDYQNSIRSCLRQARENARSIREIIPADLWEQVNTFYHDVESASEDPRVIMAPHDFLKMVVKESNEFIGRSFTTMCHDESWHFCRVARMLERSDKTSRILDVKYFYLLPTIDQVGSPLDNLQWAALLKSVSALQTYRQRFGQVDPVNVIELLLLDPDFPRSVRYCVENLLQSLERISGTRLQRRYTNDAERGAERLRSSLACARPEEVVDGGVHEFVDRLQSSLNEIGGAVFDTFFAIRDATQSQNSGDMSQVQ